MMSTLPPSTNSAASQIVDPLAGGDRGVGGRADTGERVGVLGRDWLLDPARSRTARAAAATWAAVSARTGRASRPSGRSRDRPRRARRRRRDARSSSAADSLTLAAAERIELHRAVPASDDALRQRSDPRRLVVGLVPAVGVGRHRSRNRPPRSFHTGTPRRWPIRSQHARSNAARADWPCSLGRPYSRRSIAHARRSTSNGSRR